jgi:amino-acid N-acetyltransferase
MIKIQKALKIDFTEINQLLQNASLPMVDITHSTGCYFKSVNGNNKITGAIGLEIYGQFGLLRSLVVSTEYRNKGIAKLLVEEIEKQSASLNLKALYLLTTTADKYFEKKGFIHIQRNDVREEIKQSDEFKSICPVSATIMYKSI